VVASVVEPGRFERAAEALWLAAERRFVGRRVVDVAGILSTFAELAVGLAGFAGIVAALQGKIRDWSPADQNRFWSIIIFAMATLAFSLLPLIWVACGRSPWFLCSSVLALFLFLQGGYSASLWVRHPPGFSRPVAAFMATGAVVAGLAQLRNVFVLGSNADFTQYLMGLIWLVTGSSFSFIRLLRLVFSSNDHAAK
jgi:hypothetical protein